MSEWAGGARVVLGSKGLARVAQSVLKNASWQQYTVILMLGSLHENRRLLASRLSHKVPLGSYVEIPHLQLCYSIPGTVEQQVDRSTDLDLDVLDTGWQIGAYSK